MALVLRGADALTATLAAKAVASEIAVQAGIDELGQEILRFAQDAVPVLTGHLRDSLTYERGLGSGRVFTDVVYAGQVEYGGLHNPPEPYMRPAADLADGSAAVVVMKEIVDGA